MTVKEIRRSMGLSQSNFARYFNIPVSTIRNWEQGNRTPPPYVVGMMFQILGLENCVQECLEINAKGIDDMNINFKTVEFINMLNELARKTGYGFMDFADCKEDDGYKGVVYYKGDGNHMIIDDCKKDVEGDYVVEFMSVDENHHQVISVYGADDDDYAVRLLDNNGYGKYIVVYIRDELGDFNGEIYIENGVWYYWHGGMSAQ